MTLQSIAELAWRQLFPNPSDETAISKEEFIETAKGEYAYQMWKLAKEEKATEGYFTVPSNLLTEAKLEVSDNKMDISDLQILRSLPDDLWIQNVGGYDNECKYVRTTVMLNSLLGDDDSIGDDARTYLVVGKAILFPRGVHKTPLSIIYANSGLLVNEEDVEIDDAIGGVIRVRLIEIYAGKIGKEDVTNNSNSEN